jgi:hypothetical protein
MDPGPAAAGFAALALVGLSLIPVGWLKAAGGLLILATVAAIALQLLGVV